MRKGGRFSKRAVGRVDDRDLDRGLELAAQLDELLEEEDGDDRDDVGRGREVRRQVQEGREEGGERHAADLEDVDDGDEDEKRIVARRRRFTFQRDLPFG